MAKPPHTRAQMRVFYPVFRWWELAAGWRYTTTDPDTRTIVLINRQLPTIRHSLPIEVHATSIGYEWSHSCNGSCCLSSETSQRTGKAAIADGVWHFRGDVETWQWRVGD